MGGFRNNTLVRQLTFLNRHLPPWGRFNPASRIRIVLFGCDKGSLVIKNAPAFCVPLPDGGAACDAFKLAQRVGHQKYIRAELPKRVVMALPTSSGRIHGRMLFQFT